ncbi:protein FAR1-RELATED SEQUENCE 5-like [Rosa chinensis]|uniref:protein FAR1-RELATED SEQUENCE 5-like n=1 Tax=Rosa chinensis TaxID=74649 RepID=UPI000D097969|nr:protein FAR1-RELATED SEQUENCE 5-like [Rosa chinensis]
MVKLNILDEILEETEAGAFSSLYKFRVLRGAKVAIIDVESDDENNEDNNREDPSIVNRQGSFDEDDLFGKMVCSEVEAYEFYNSYATRIGFSVRKGKKIRDAKNVVRQINFMCSKEGFQQDSDPSETKRADRLDTRTGCKAMIRFTLAEDMWRVSHFHAEHNDELAKPEERPFLRSNRKMYEAHKGVIKTMRDARIGTIKTYSYLAEEVGRSQNVGFTKRDCYNFVNNEKMAMFEAGDAQSLINLFKRKQTEDPMFFYSVQVDQENRMTNFFWRDGRSRLDYECFGDASLHVPYDSNFFNTLNVLRSTSRIDQMGSDSKAFYQPNVSFTSMLLSQELHSTTDEQQQGSSHMPYYLP